MALVLWHGLVVVCASNISIFTVCSCSRELGILGKVEQLRKKLRWHRDTNKTTILH